MKKSMKILTAITSFSPAVFFVFGVIMLAMNAFINVKATTEPMSDAGGTASMSDSMVILSIIFAILLIIIITLFCVFNIIFDIVYIVKSGRFTSESTVLWIILTALFGTVTAPIFWCIYPRPLSPDEPMFPQKETATY